MQARDYHVGLLRGFILAHNAPAIILHALDVVVPRIEKGSEELIGKPVVQPGTPLPDPPETKEPVTPTPDDKIDKPGFFWTRQEDAILESMVAEGKKLAAIKEALPNRTSASIQNRISIKGYRS